MSDLLVDSDSIRKATFELMSGMPDDRTARACVRGIGTEAPRSILHSFVRTAEEAAEKAIHYASKCLLDVTLNIALVDEVPKGNDGIREATASGVFGLGFDLDIRHPVHNPKKNYPPTIEEALECLPMEPTWIVHTGHGVHAWYLFEEPYFFDDDLDRQRVRLASAAFHKACQARAASLGSFQLDAAFDLARGYRLPGTVNYKEPGNPRLVRWTDSEGPRWNFLDFEEFASENLVHFLGKDAKRYKTYAPGEQPWRIEERYRELLVSSDRRSDPERLKGLFEIDKRFHQTYKHERRDISDESNSGYDYSLAGTALKSGFTLQEAVDLLIDCRTFHGVPFSSKGRDYYLRTVWKKEQDLKGPDVTTVEEAEAARAVETATVEPPKDDTAPAPKKKPATARKSAPDSVSPPPLKSNGSANGHDPLVRKGLMAGQLSTFFGVPVLRLLKIMTEEPSYKIEFEGGRAVNVPNSTYLRSNAHMSNILFAKLSHNMPVWDKQEWPKIWQIYLDAEIPIDPSDPEATDAGKIEMFLNEYLFDVPLVRNLEELREQPELPMIDGDLKISISGPHFRQWLRDKKKFDVTAQAMSPMLLNIGCPPEERIQKRGGPGGKRFRAYRWILPADKFDAGEIIEHRNSTSAARRSRFSVDSDPTLTTQ